MWWKRAIRTDYQIKKLENWLKQKDFTLIKGRQKHIRDEVNMEKKIVFLSTRQNLLNQLYGLLHECRTCYD